MRKNNPTRKREGSDGKSKPRFNKESKPFEKFRSKSDQGFKKKRSNKDFRKKGEEGETRNREERKDQKKDFSFSNKFKGKPDWKSGEGKKKFKSDSGFKKEKYPSRDRDEKLFSGDDRKSSGFKRGSGSNKEKKEEHRAGKQEFKSKKPRFSKPRKTSADSGFEKRVKYDDFEEGRSFKEKDEAPRQKFSRPASKPSADSENGLTRLNKYLSNAGIASRRDADTLIASGAVKVNGVVVDQMGYKIKAGDKVTYGGESVKGERKVYLLLNKPKDYITTLDDPQERKTVMLLIAGACRERVYPVGRLDRNTTGLLLFTNDGELTTKLTHPKYGVKKIYHVSLNKGLKPEDFKSIVEGVELEDGIIKADDVAFVGEGKKEIGIEVHSGRNRIVRRLFEHLGYDVIKLDRVAFAGLTKKDLPRGKHRFLTAKEISFLQMIG